MAFMSFEGGVTYVYLDSLKKWLSSAFRVTTSVCLHQDQKADIHYPTNDNSVPGKKTESLMGDQGSMAIINTHTILGEDVR
eukprot:c35099_g1_i1 orf=58-300(+)